MRTFEGELRRTTNKGGLLRGNFAFSWLALDFV